MEGVSPPPWVVYWNQWISGAIINLRNPNSKAVGVSLRVPHGGPPFRKRGGRP
jgi:hypothetical protein